MTLLKKFKRILRFSLLIVATLMMSVSWLFAEDKPADVKDAPATTSPAVEEKPTGDATIGVLSQYFWRGYELSRNSIVIQPSLTVAYKGFSANIWGNLDTKPYFAAAGDSPFTSTLNETDLTLSYTKTLGLFNLGGGYIYYALAPLNKDFPKRADAQELFVSLGFNTWLTPTFTVFKEIDHYRQWYVLLAISHTLEFSRFLSLKLSATASYLQSTYADATLFNTGTGYGGYPKFDSNALATNDKFSNFHDGNLTVSLPVRVTKYITVTPTISYIFPLSNDAKNEMKGQGLKGTAPGDRDSSFVYGGLTASFSF
jgi:hypothetical protein